MPQRGRSSTQLSQSRVTTPSKSMFCTFHGRIRPENLPLLTWTDLGMERDAGTRRQGCTVTSEQLQGTSHAGLYRTSRRESCNPSSRQGESCWHPHHRAIPDLPARASCLTGSTGKPPRVPLRAGSIVPSPSTTGGMQGCCRSRRGRPLPNPRSPGDACGRGKAGASHLEPGSGAGRLLSA